MEYGTSTRLLGFLGKKTPGNPITKLAKLAKIAIFTILALTITNCSALQSGWPCQTGNWTDPITERCGRPHSH